MSTAALAIIVDSPNSPPMVIADRHLLIQAFRKAVQCAEDQARSSDPFEAQSGRSHATILRRLLSEVTGRSVPPEVVREREVSERKLSRHHSIPSGR
jgi:hypothetical protein